MSLGCNEAPSPTMVLENTQWEPDLRLSGLPSPGVLWGQATTCTPPSSNELPFLSPPQLGDARGPLTAAQGKQGHPTPTVTGGHTGGNKRLRPRKGSEEAWQGVGMRTLPQAVIRTPLCTSMEPKWENGLPCPPQVINQCPPFSCWSDGCRKQPKQDSNNIRKLTT